jgi:hypothetical protein
MAAITECDINDVIRLAVTFADGGTAVDPGAVTIKIRPPVGDIVTYVYGTDAALVRTATGAYRVDYEPTMHGTYQWRAIGSSTNKAAGEGTFRVRDSAFD